MLIEVNTLRFGDLSVECQPDLKVLWLRREIAQRLSVRSFEQIGLVCNGKPPLDEDKISSLSGGSVLAVVRPGQPGGAFKPVQEPVTHQTGLTDNDDDDDDNSFSLPANASPAAQRVANFLQRTLNIPNHMVSLLFKVRAKVWIILLLWLCGAKLSSWLNLGPLYIIGSIIALVFGNLGHRQQGEASAYSIFNNFRSLPGQLTADQVDGQVRRGQF